MAVGLIASSSSIGRIKADSSSSLVLGPPLFLLCMPAACGMYLAASNRKVCESGGPGEAGSWCGPAPSAGRGAGAYSSAIFWVGFIHQCGSPPMLAHDGVHLTLFSDATLAA